MPVYTYRGITKDNWSEIGNFHETKDKNCLFNAGYYCNQGANITVRGVVTFDTVAPYFLSNTAGVNTGDGNIFMQNEGGYYLIGIVPSDGTFTLQVVEYYLPIQTRLIG